MILSGLQPLTLIDYPGKISAIIFTRGCNFRCSFCHNPELVDMKMDALNISEEEVFAFLKKRKGLLDGVCITGGEPTIHKDLSEFIARIREMGFDVKLDSNGSRPDILEKILSTGNVDYVAMDIKHSLIDYKKAMGTDIDIQKIRTSIDILRNGSIDYEFRTTVVPGIHRYEDFSEIRKDIEGAKRYFLQEYRDVKVLNPEHIAGLEKEEIDLDKLKKDLEPYFGEVGIRR